MSATSREDQHSGSTVISERQIVFNGDLVKHARCLQMPVLGFLRVSPVAWEMRKRTDHMTERTIEAKQFYNCKLDLARL